MILGEKIKTAFGMPLLDKMEFNTLGGSTVSVKFSYKFEEGTFDWCPVFKVCAFAEVHDRGDMSVLNYNTAIPISRETENPAVIIKHAQTECITKFLDEVLHSGVK